MAKGGIGRALGFIAAGMGQGYATGAMQDVTNRRQEVLEELRAKRAAQADQQDREFRMQETEKSREFQREQFGEEKEWQKEKFGLEQAADESRFQRQLSLKGAGGGSGGGQEAITRTITDAEGKIWGITKTGKKVDLELQGKVSGGGISVGDRPSSQMKRATEIATLKARKEKREVTEDDILNELNRLSGSKKSGPGPDKFLDDVEKAHENLTDIMNPASKKYRDNPDAAWKDAEAMTRQRWQSVGMEPPQMATEESKAGSPQPQAMESPPTSTHGDTPTLATPPGQGSEASPFVITTEEQKAWFKENAPPGTWGLYNGQLGKKK